MEALAYLTNIAIILLIGVFVAIISTKLKISNILLLVVTGIILSKLTYYGKRLFVFPDTFLIALATLALVIVVLDATSKFKWKTFGAYTGKALKLSIYFMIINLLLLSIATSLIFKIDNIFLVLIFSSVMIGTSADIILPMLKNSKNKVVKMLKIESLVNTPITVLIPFIILNLMQTLNLSSILWSKILEQLKPFISQFVVGIGAGVFVGLIMAKAMKTKYFENISHLALITSALLTYIIAENLNGNGVLAVTAMGLIFGNLYIKQKERLYSFAHIFESSLLVLVFILIGIGIDVPLNDIYYWLKAFFLFIIYLVIRFIAVSFCFKKDSYRLKEKIFMALVIPKGIAVAVVAFTLTTKVLEIPALSAILSLIIVFMLFSLIISTITSRFDKWFLDKGRQ